MFRLFWIVVFLFHIHLFSAEKCEAIILGGGVGGISSAIYLARAGYQPIVIEGKLPGGLLTQSDLIQNWPSEKGISGYELVQKIKNQAIACGVKFLSEEVIHVDFEKQPVKIETKNLFDSSIKNTYFAKSCIIAMGTTPNMLNVNGEKIYWGRGISNCAVCDGFLYKGKTVAVIGGGDAAILEAQYLSKLAKKVYVFVRKDALKTVEQNRKNKLLQQKNVHVVFNTTVEEILGDGENVHSVKVLSHHQMKKFSVDGIFLAIGSSPNTALFSNKLELDKQGYIILKKDQQTSVEGVFAVGDIVDPVYKQAVSASGDGAKAALQAKEFLSSFSD